MASELRAVAARIHAAADALDDVVAQQRLRGYGPQGASARTTSKLAVLARRYLRHRRSRDTLFPPDLFGDPAWDLLLDLYVAGIERRRISISSACIAAAVPQTTALRWIALLESRGLILRMADTDDRRRAYLTLAPRASAVVETWLQGMSDICGTHSS